MTDLSSLMTGVPPEAVRLALVARSHALIDRPDPTALSEERLTEMMLEAALPAIRAEFAARLEARDSPLCDCRHEGGSEPTSPRTGLPMAHHCDCATAKLAAMVLGPGVLTTHERDCDGEEPWIRRLA